MQDASLQVGSLQVCKFASLQVDPAALFPMSLHIALMGNPNTGKTTIFNALTGMNQHVGNWPGKTVEKKEGVFTHNGRKIRLVDLPGTYSLSAFSPEEAIARDYLLGNALEAVIVVLDAANLERNLFLAAQVQELGVPTLFVLNMMDAAAARKIKIDTAVLSRHLNAPIVTTIARKGEGVDALKTAVVAIASQNGDTPLFELTYGADIEAGIDEIRAQMERFPAIMERYPARWLAVNLLEQDEILQQQVMGIEGGSALLTIVQLTDNRLQTAVGESIEIGIADNRYKWIHALVEKAVERPQMDMLTRSDKIDRIVTNRWAGIPIFMLLMWAVFKLTADVSAPYLEWIGGVLDGPVTHWMISLLTAVGADGTWIESLFVDGIIAGVGGVLVFVPVLSFLYLALAVLENSGYMARAAFVMDSAMHRIGLHGKSFLPLLVGFGCTVPAIYATRTLENEKDRILTGLLVPFMSCGARLPVYVLFAAIFFPDQGGAVVFGLYLLGIVTAVLLALLLRKTAYFAGEANAFVMELPPYRMPAIKGVWLHTWVRIRSFLESAWTIILASSIIIWILVSIPIGGKGDFADVAMEDSAFAAVAGITAPVFEPLGFGSWEAGSALLSGFIAKEVVVSTMAQVYNVEADAEAAEFPSFIEDVTFIFSSFAEATVDTARAIPLVVGIDLSSEDDEPEPTELMLAVRQNFEETSGGYGSLAALAFMVFVLMYTPCMVAVAAEKHELGARWMWATVIGQLLLAWVFAFIVFQGGKVLIGF